MKKYLAGFIFLPVLLFYSCGSAPKMVNKKPIELDWICGKWKQKDADIYEKWVKLSDREYSGLSYDMNAGYATIKEKMRIFTTDGVAWQFEAIIKENNNIPILFKWIPDPVITLKFVNEKHDFPQIIQYKKEAFDVMSAQISNLAGDKKMIFDYSRYAIQ